MCCNSPDVAPRVLHRGVSIAIRHVDGSFYGKSASLERSSIGLVSILHIDIQKVFRASRAGPPSLTKIKESPILILAGAPIRISPWAPKTSLRKPTTPRTSSVNTLGIMVGQPSGWKLVISQVSPRVKLSWRVEPRNYPITCRSLHYHFPLHPAGLGTCRDGLLWGMSTHRLGCCRGLGQ